MGKRKQNSRKDTDKDAKIARLDVERLEEENQSLREQLNQIIGANMSDYGQDSEGRESSEEASEEDEETEIPDESKKDLDESSESGAEKEEENNDKNTKDEAQPLQESTLAAFGEDALESNKTKAEIHPEILRMVGRLVSKGLDEKVNQELLKKYDVPPEIAPPEVNRELMHNMSAHAKKKDGHRHDVQKDASVALTILASLITTLDKETESIDVQEFKEKLIESAKLAANVIHRETESRRAFITPTFKCIESILKTADSGKELYGTGLKSKIEEVDTLDKFSKAFKRPHRPKLNANNNYQNNYQRDFLFKGPPMNNRDMRRPYYFQQNTAAGGPARQRLYFRRNNQQNQGKNYQNQQGQNRNKQNRTK